jgi:[acyl-carrier-protein] S-malonyltransferase
MALGILCPGQGDQHPAMFDHLRTSAAARALFDEAAEIIGTHPLALTPEAFHVNRIAQPLVCAVQLATWAEIRDGLEAPTVFAGYSVGELAAYGCAGAFTPTDVLRLARRRAELMDGACGEANGMLAVRGLAAGEIEVLCGRTGCMSAIVNGVDRFVVGGRKAALGAFERAAEASGAKVTSLAISIASHTSLMTAAVAPFITALEACPWRVPSAPVLAGISGAAVRTRPAAIAALGRQIDHTLDWAACLDGLVERGCTVLLELGPGSGLARMARDRFPDLPVRACGEFGSLRGAIDWAARSA